jgi:uncharacterized phage infection (PIP) family protein YhgE
VKLAPLLLVALALAACGGSDDGGGQAEAYANNVCTDLSTWVTSIQGNVDSLKNTTLATAKDDVDKAVSDVSDSTDQLASDLKAQGAPRTDNGDTAKAELDSLATQLSDQVDVVTSALESDAGAVTQVATISTALAAMETAVKSTYASLKELDPAGELQDAFKSSDSCKSLQDQVEKLGS